MSAESHSKMGHIQSLKTYLFVWVFLLIMTGVTVGAYFLHIESPFLRLVVAMIIAAIKCTAVILYFMHGKYEGKIIWAFIYYPLILLGTLVLFLYVDYGNREPGINVNDYAALQSQYKGTFENYKAHKKGGGSHGEDSHDAGTANDHGGDSSAADDHSDATADQGDAAGDHGDTASEPADDVAAADAAAADAAAADAAAAEAGASADTTSDPAADTPADNTTEAETAAATATSDQNATVANASGDNATGQDDSGANSSDSDATTASSGWGDLPGDPEAGKAKAKMLCIACHIIDGAGNKLPQAPPFEESANLERITPEYLYKWMDDPQSIKPGTLMPDLALSDEDIQNLIAFLATYKND